VPERNPKNPDVALGFCGCGCGQSTKLAPVTAARLGWRKGVPISFVNGHNPRKGNEYRIEDRGHETPCWIWNLYINPNGYGRTTVDCVGTTAHRAYYERHKGPISEGLEIDHLCRVKACCNPDHLEAVTRAVNQRRGNAGNLSTEDMLEIVESSDTDLSVSRRFNCTPSNIARIRERWTAEELQKEAELWS
jgi:hypothetical protein